MYARQINVPVAIATTPPPPPPVTLWLSHDCFTYWSEVCVVCLVPTYVSTVQIKEQEICPAWFRTRARATGVRVRESSTTTTGQLLLHPTCVELILDFSMTWSSLAAIKWIAKWWNFWELQHDVTLQCKLDNGSRMFERRDHWSSASRSFRLALSKLAGNRGDRWINDRAFAIQSD